ncbi:alba 2 [Besnoitia besnoiti]|uniref:Alba 2 n=1 Tax=Besnoitia besnoiti TaxID=94643 RepID=A0A2A9MP06_BESBE|nr:alba 2 [Besnoitia besnoiti]PFH37500.1 alba 2 [Besnoitia besnoiti]
MAEVVATPAPNATAPPAVDTTEGENMAANARSDNSILVSMDKIPGFYARIGKRMLVGRDDKPPCDEVIITGLGMATKTAIGAASLLQRDNSATITKVETSYFPSTRTSLKMVPKITIICTKTPEFSEQIKKDKEAALAEKKPAANAVAA